MKKYITKAFIATMIVVGVASCQKEEDRVFDKSVSERLSEQEKKLQDLLLSSEYGWKMVYVTDPEGFGGFTYLMRFKDARNVEMISDFSRDGVKKETTEYAIHQRATTSLVFTTRAKIHELSDPANSPYGGGNGYYGEYQYGYYGHTENEIYFKTPKHDTEVTFVKATKEDWDTFSERFDMEVGMNRTDLTSFRTMEIETVGQKKSYDFTFGASVRLMELQEPINNLNLFSVYYVPHGIGLKPSLVIDGKEIKEFTLDKASGSFIGVNGDLKVSIKYSNDPANWTDTSYKKLMVSPSNPKTSTFSFRVGTTMFNSSFVSPFLKEKIISYGKTGTSYSLSQIDMKFNTTFSINGKTEEGHIAEYTYKGVKYARYFQMEEKPGNKVKIVTVGWSRTVVPDDVKELDQLFLGDSMYVRVEKSKVQYTNTVVSFISTNAPISVPTWDLSSVL
ncbi:MAG: DUF4302 domain-containing protein [Flavobacterium sp.]